MTGDLRDPRVEAGVLTGVVARSDTGTGRPLGYGRFGCGGDRLQGREVPAQGHASLLGESRIRDSQADIVHPVRGN